jgi:hypothetical protein
MGRSRRILAPLVCLLGLGALNLVFTPTVSAADEHCPQVRQVDDGTAANALTPPIVLTPETGSAQRIVNFGTSRAPKPVTKLRFVTDKPLPASVTPEQLNFDAFLSRAGDTLDSTDFPDPRFSAPRISQDRQSITFTACLDPGSIPPGKYVGSITLSGPPGLSAASVALTVNAKTQTWFGIGAGLSLLAAFVLLVLKDAAAFRRKSTTNPPDWAHSFLHPIADPIWWATTVVALAAAFGTLWAVYASNPAWGSGGFSDASALIGATFAAVGGHTIISTLTPS